MKIVFLGGVLDERQEEYIINNQLSEIDSAANVFQKKIIRGLRQNCDVDVVSMPFICPYPKKSRILKYVNSENSDESSTYINFINIWGIRNISRYINLQKFIYKNKKKIEEYDAIVVYSLHAPFIKMLRKIKKINKDIKVIVVVPDLPEYMNLSNNISWLYKRLKKIDIKIIESNKRYIDGYIVLTKYMIDKLNDFNKKFEIIEGISEVSDSTEVLREDKHIVFMYAGTLEKKYGILNLLEAFSDIKDDSYELIICGKGETENIIRESTKRDSRIKFYGMISHEKVMQLMRKADILVNPRIDQEFAKYSFPSKILEYLEQRKLVISYKLKCFGDEYEEYIFYPQEQNCNSLKNTMLKVASMNDEDKIEHLNRQIQFLKKYKSAKYQTKKIIDLINGMEK